MYNGNHRFITKYNLAHKIQKLTNISYLFTKKTDKMTKKGNRGKGLIMYTFCFMSYKNKNAKYKTMLSWLKP